ncbi:hypothetical protein AAVH_17854, partial [Aphelenchoides avenae]
MTSTSAAALSGLRDYPVVREPKACLETYCEKHVAVPDDPDQPYVLDYEVNSTDSFYVIWTTVKLLERQLNSSQLQADATSSTNWHNYPFVVVGHSNVDHNFVPTLAAGGKSEDRYVYGAIFRALAQRNYRPSDILADGTPAVTSAAETHFPHAVRIMCFARVIRRFDAVHKPKLPKHLQEHMRNEICLLQRRERRRILRYVCGTYIHGDLRLWHEGATDHCVNNNGLDCANLSIKRDHTLRRMLAFATFLEKVEQLVRYWSTHAKKPTISLKAQKAAYDLQKECEDKENGQQKRLYARIKDTHQYVFASASSAISSLEQLFEAYNRSYVVGPETWGDYSECRFE